MFIPYKNFAIFFGVLLLFSTCNNSPKEVKNEKITNSVKIIETIPKEVLAGRKIFIKYCEQCHSLVEDGKKIGPPLTNLHYVETFKWFRTFVKYPQKVIETGNKRAIMLYGKYKQYMPSYDKLTDEEIANLWLYFNAQSNLLPQKDSIKKAMQNLEKAEISKGEWKSLPKYAKK